MPILRRRKFARSPRHSRSTEFSLSTEWQRWIAENLLRGVEAGALFSTLVARGLDPATTKREISRIASSPILDLARENNQWAGKLGQLTKLRRQLLASASAPKEIERREGLSGEEFFERYYCQGVPVIVTDIVRHWPAYQAWSPAYFKEAFGHVPVRFTANRNSDPQYDQNTDAHTVAATMAEFIDRITSMGESNDVYMVANNRNLDDGPLRKLLQDIRIPTQYLHDREGCLSCLWVGPAGTITPLHHDTTNIFFCQVVGRKHFRLVSPFETALLEDLDGVYSPMDLERPDMERFPGLRDVLVKEAVVEPGEAIFLPVGMFHQVKALDVSISVSFVNFLRGNDFGWYMPGR